MTQVDAALLEVLANASQAMATQGVAGTWHRDAFELAKAQRPCPALQGRPQPAVGTAFGSRHGALGDMCVWAADRAVAAALSLAVDSAYSHGER